MAGKKIVGRTKHSNVTNSVIAYLVKAGFKMTQIAEMIGISEKTLYNWINKDEQLLQDVSTARELVNQNFWAATFGCACFLILPLTTSPDFGSMKFFSSSYS